ncbi:MAG: hypothetical protein NXY57DRAFT_313235 [Lentinula lateritia]|nr:MAG: hypothetical protein NXY57DRAFT_313235 [Lentinula lateritia]
MNGWIIEVLLLLVVGLCFCFVSSFPSSIPRLSHPPLPSLSPSFPPSLPPSLLPSLLPSFLPSIVSFRFSEHSEFSQPHVHPISRIFSSISQTERATFESSLFTLISLFSKSHYITFPPPIPSVRLRFFSFHSCVCLPSLFLCSLFSILSFLFLFPLFSLFSVLFSLFSDSVPCSLDSLFSPSFNCLPESQISTRYSFVCELCSSFLSFVRLFVVLFILFRFFVLLVFFVSLLFCLFLPFVCFFSIFDFSCVLLLFVPSFVRLFSSFLRLFVFFVFFHFFSIFVSFRFSFRTIHTYIHTTCVQPVYIIIIHAYFLERSIFGMESSIEAWMICVGWMM